MSCPTEGNPSSSAKIGVRKPGGGCERRDGEKQAIVVGVARYKRARALSLSVRDAKAFAAFLQQKMGFAPGSVTLMTDDAPDEADRPTYVNLRGALRRLTESVDHGKVVL